MDLDWCKQPDRGLPAPDAVLFLDLSVEDAANRGAFGSERYEKEEMQRRVRENFYTLMEDPADSRANYQWHLIDARGSIDEVSSRINDVAETIVDNVKEQGNDIGVLWE